MADQSFDEILQAIIDESAEIETLEQEKEKLQQDVLQMQNGYEYELKKKMRELQTMKDRKAQMKGEIKKLRGTKMQLMQVHI